MKHRRLLLIIIGFLITLLSLLGAVLFDIGIKEWFKENLTQTAINVALIFVLILIFLGTFLLDHYQRKSHQPDELKTPEEKEEAIIQEFFNSLKTRYHDRLEHKLAGRFRITLEVSENWDDQNPREFDIRYDKSTQISDAFEFVSYVFDNAGGRLLIVGNAGVGKTVLLLNFAWQQLSKADVSKKEAFPVIFNLASWSEEYKEFDDWLLAILETDSILSKEKGAAGKLITEMRIIPFLDGLDELARTDNEGDKNKRRAICLNSLRNYVRDGRKVVICCRDTEFLQFPEATKQKVPVWAKTKILNLTEAQILSSLKEAQADKNNKDSASANNLLGLMVNKSYNKRLEAFLGEIKADKTKRTQHSARAKRFFKRAVNKQYHNLLEVIQIPFFFSTALYVFDQPTLTEKDFPTDKAEFGNYLMGKYVDEKLKKPHKDFAPEKTRKWLKWLAGTMQDKQAVTFEISDLQPTDLSKRWIYYSLSFYFSLLPLGLIGGLGLFVIVRSIFSLVIGLLSGLVVGLVPSLIEGLIQSLEFIVKERIKPKGLQALRLQRRLQRLHTLKKRSKPIDSKDADQSGIEWRRLLKRNFWGKVLRLLYDRVFWQHVLAEGLVRDVAFGLFVGLAMGFSNNLVAGLFWGLTALSLGTLITGLTIILKAKKSTDIIQTEGIVRLDYSKLFKRGFWDKNLSKGMRKGALVGLILGFIAGVLIVIFEGAPIKELLRFMAGGALLGWLGGLGYGFVLSFENLKITREHAKIQTPYQRLRGSVLPDLIFVLLVLAITIASVVLIDFNKEYSDSGRFFLLVYFLALGIALLSSVEVLTKHAVAKHFPLRIALYFEDAMPLKYAKFLDYVSGLGILEKDGGQWRFRHQHLQEYFAEHNQP
jgi:predicted negative regulator of RcsB-dependent stress response